MNIDGQKEREREREREREGGGGVGALEKDAMFHYKKTEFIQLL